MERVRPVCARSTARDAAARWLRGLLTCAAALCLMSCATQRSSFEGTDEDCGPDGDWSSCGYAVHSDVVAGFILRDDPPADRLEPALRRALVQAVERADRGCDRADPRKTRTACESLVAWKTLRNVGGGVLRVADDRTLREQGFTSEERLIPVDIETALPIAERLCFDGPMETDRRGRELHRKRAHGSWMDGWLSCGVAAQAFAFGLGGPPDEARAERALAVIVGKLPALDPDLLGQIPTVTRLGALVAEGRDEEALDLYEAEGPAARKAILRLSIGDDDSHERLVAAWWRRAEVRWEETVAPHVLAGRALAATRAIRALALQDAPSDHAELGAALVERCLAWQTSARDGGPGGQARWLGNALLDHARAAFACGPGGPEGSEKVRRLRGRLKQVARVYWRITPEDEPCRALTATLDRKETYGMPTRAATIERCRTGKEPIEEERMVTVRDEGPGRKPRRPGAPRPRGSTRPPAATGGGGYTASSTTCSKNSLGHTVCTTTQRRVNLGGGGGAGASDGEPVRKKKVLKKVVTGWMPVYQLDVRVPAASDDQPSEERVALSFTEFALDPYASIAEKQAALKAGAALYKTPTLPAVARSVEEKLDKLFPANRSSLRARLLAEARRAVAEGRAADAEHLYVTYAVLGGELGPEDAWFGAADGLAPAEVVAFIRAL